MSLFSHAEGRGPTNMRSTTQLLIDYCDRTNDFDFPENVELFIEEDYLKNRALYTDSVFSIMMLLLCINSDDLNPEYLIRYAITINSDSGKSTPNAEPPTEISDVMNGQ